MKGTGGGVRIRYSGHGIGVGKGNAELLDAVNQTLRKMMTDGSWAKLLEKDLPGIKAPAAPPRDWRTLPTN